MTLKEQLAEVVDTIERREEERRQIYEDSQVDMDEHPRLAALNQELEQLWDLKRRIEAAISAGLTMLPVPPPVEPEELVE